MADQEHKRKRAKNGVIVAFGPGCTRDDLAIGDNVLFNAYTGNKITPESEGEWLLIPEDLILAKIEGNPVKLFDSETIKRIISERCGEISVKNLLVSKNDLKDIEESLLDRIDSFTQAEGMEY